MARKIDPQSVNQRRPWQDEGISKSTWYARIRAAKLPPLKEVLASNRAGRPLNALARATLIEVMSDRRCPPAARVAAAKAALAHVRARAEGKKLLAQQAAEHAATEGSTSWGDDLTSNCDLGRKH